MSDRCEGTKKYNFLHFVDPQIKYVIDHMKGWAHVECDNSTKDCKMTRT